MSYGTVWYQRHGFSGGGRGERRRRSQAPWHLQLTDKICSSPDGDHEGRAREGHITWLQRHSHCSPASLDEKTLPSSHEAFIRVVSLYYLVWLYGVRPATRGFAPIFLSRALSLHPRVLDMHFVNVLYWFATLKRSIQDPPERKNSASEILIALITLRFLNNNPLVFCINMCKLSLDFSVCIKRVSWISRGE